MFKVSPALLRTVKLALFAMMLGALLLIGRSVSAGPTVGYGGNSPSSLQLCHSNGYCITLSPGTLTGNRAITLGNLAVDTSSLLTFTNNYQSATRTATGSAEAVAHGLGRTPQTYWVEILSGHNGSGAAGNNVCSVSYGTVDGTNVTVTVSQACTYRVHAF